MQYRQGYQPPPLPPPDPVKKPSRRPLILALALLLAAGLTVGGVLIAQSIRRQNEAHQALVEAVEAYADVYGPNIIVDGIDLGGMDAQAAVMHGALHRSAKEHFLAQPRHEADDKQAGKQFSHTVDVQ